MIQRTALTAACFALLTSVAAAEPHYVADASQSPHAVVRPVGVDEVSWGEGFWGDQARRCRDVSIPAMGDLMRSSKYKPFYEHFLIAAGEAEGDYHGAPWNDGDFYKWIEAATFALQSKPDAELSAFLDEAVRAIAAAQREDGYVHTPVLIRNRNGDASAKPFADRNDFEVYNLGHLMTAGCLRYRVTGKDDLLACAKKAAAFLEEAFRDPSPQLARQAVCPSHYMGLVEMFRTTRDMRYLDLAKRVLELRNVAAGVAGGGGDDNQDRIPFVDQREAVGHAVRANYLYAGAADLYLETGDERLLPALEAVWENVTQKKLYVTGACGALYDGASPDASPNQREITRIHQAYGRNYQLPNETAHNETCAAVGAVLWNWRRYLANGESRHVDWIELAMHNAVLSGVSLAGTEYFYTNPLRVTDPAPTDIRWSRTREEFIVSYCCPPNVVRTVAEMAGYAYAKSGDTLYVNLYGSNTLDTELESGRIRLRQETNYPWDGDIRFTIVEAPREPVELHLRVPTWALDGSRGVGAAVSWPEELPGPDAAEEDPSTSAFREKRVWRTGDEFLLSLNMSVALLESHPLVEETRNQLAVKRGPIVYCLESIDLPEGVTIDEVAISPDTPFKVERDPELLGGVPTLVADAAVVDSTRWRSLYRPAEVAEPETVPVRLVPYYAWGNRGPSEMTVWLQRR